MRGDEARLRQFAATARLLQEVQGKISGVREDSLGG
jgi:hypothetical protein